MGKTPKNGYELVPSFYKELTQLLHSDSKVRRDAKKILFEQFFGVELPMLLKGGNDGTDDTKLLQKFIFGKRVQKEERPVNTILMRQHHYEYDVPVVQFVPQKAIMKRGSYQNMESYLNPLIKFFDDSEHYQGKKNEVLFKNSSRLKEQLKNSIIDSENPKYQEVRNLFYPEGIFYKSADGKFLPLMSGIINSKVKREYAKMSVGEFDKLMGKDNKKFLFYRKDGDKYVVFGERYGYQSPYTMLEYLYDLFGVSYPKYKESGEKKIFSYLKKNLFEKDKSSITHGQEFYTLPEDKKNKVLHEEYLKEFSAALSSTKLGDISGNVDDIIPHELKDKITGTVKKGKEKLTGFIDRMRAKSKTSEKEIQQVTLKNWSEISEERFEEALEAYKKAVKGRNKLQVKSDVEGLTTLYQLLRGTLRFQTGKPRQFFIDTGNRNEMNLKSVDEVKNRLVKFFS